jgi:O-antigen ligase
VLVIAGIGLAVGSAMHFGARVTDRTSQASSTNARLSEYSETLTAVEQSPILGYGAPAASTTDPNSPQLGTQGELWTLLYSSGFPGTALFILALAGFCWRTRDAPTPPAVWLHTVPVAALAMLAVYRLEGTELVLVMVATALLLRDRAPRRPRMPVVAPQQTRELVRARS